jgi:hypothetical protein
MAQVSAVNVELNTLFGQYSVCNPLPDGEGAGYACNATWSCDCSSQWGDHKGPFCKSTDNDQDDDCSCLLLGGCTASVWGAATESLTVGHLALLTPR